MDTTVLVVEDDPAVGKNLVICLEREGYRVLWCETGTEALQKCVRHSPHLIVLDIRLPDMSGLDVCNQVRNMGFTQPILMLSVYNEDADIVSGLEIGADDYLTKPFSITQLRARIRALLRRGYGTLSHTQSELLYCGNLVIDVMKNQVRQGEYRISLSPLEFRLLLHLARHPGQVFSRQQLFEAVWGYDTGDESTVTVYVHRLREKLEAAPKVSCEIITVPGVGYHLEAEAPSSLLTGT